jgi:hypothetical protein
MPLRSNIRGICLDQPKLCRFTVLPVVILLILLRFALPISWLNRARAIRVGCLSSMTSHPGFVPVDLSTLASLSQDPKETEGVNRSFSDLHTLECIGKRFFSGTKVA